MAVYRRNDTKSKRWFYKFEIDGAVYKSAVPTARTRRQAEEAERQAREDVHHGRYVAKWRGRSITFERFAKDEYLPWAKQHRAGYQGRVAAVDLFCEHFGSKPLGQISQITVERFKLAYLKSETRWGRPPMPSTVNQRIQILSAIMSHAVGLKYRRDNPCNGVEPLPVPDTEARFLTAEEAALLAADVGENSPAWVLDALLVGLGTGLRGEELLGLTKDAVDFARDLLFVAKPKAKKDPRRTQGVPMSSEVREILLRLSRESPSRHLFVRPGTGERVSLSMFDHRLEEACARIGLIGVHPHTLRHTFGTRLGDADVNVKKIQRLMGHADIKMTLKYIHPDDGSLRTAVEKTTVARPENVPGEGQAATAVLRKQLRAVG
jgi:integrase